MNVCCHLPENKYKKTTKKKKSMFHPKKGTRKYFTYFLLRNSIVETKKGLKMEGHRVQMLWVQREHNIEWLNVTLRPLYNSNWSEKLEGK